MVSTSATNSAISYVNSKHSKCKFRINYNRLILYVNLLRLGSIFFSAHILFQFMINTKWIGKTPHLNTWTAENYAYIPSY